MTEYLYAIGIRHKETGDTFDLFVWAENTDQATCKLTKAIFGPNGAYVWTGSGPVYKDNAQVTRTREVQCND